MKPIFHFTAAASLLVASPLFAQSIVDQLVGAYQERGFDFIEIQQGLSQIKVEATMNGQTVEVIYDAVTGVILDSEVYTADASDLNRTGLEIRQRDRDFEDLRADIRSDDSYGRDDDDRWSDDDSHDDRNDDHGNDDYGNDDHGSDDHGSDDHGSDDSGDDHDDDHGNDDHGDDHDDD